MLVQKSPAKFVSEVMQFSRFGPLAAQFVLEAISQRAQDFAKAEPDTLRREGYHHPEAMIGLAREVLGKLAVYYGVPETAPAEERSAA